MILIVGGAYQGKTEYALKNYGLDRAEIANGKTFDFENTDGIKCISDYHEAVKRFIENGTDPIEISEKLIGKNPDIIIVMNEIGNGIVPIDKSQRVWREQTGKTGCFLAERADEVIRITCGCGVKIKG